MVFGTRAMVTGSDAYTLSRDLLATHPAVVADIGAPVRIGLMPYGNVGSFEGNGRAELVITLSGPLGEGHGGVTLRRTSGQWKVTHAVWIHNGRLQPLVTDGAPAGVHTDSGKWELLPERPTVTL